MSPNDSDRRSRLRDWGATDPDPHWLRRPRDPLSWPSAGGLVLGVIVMSIIWAAFDPFNVQTTSDVNRAVQEGIAEGSAGVRAEGFEVGYAAGFAQGIQEQALEGTGSFADGYRSGHADGWNDAIDALEAAARAKGLGDDSTELATLNEMERR